MSFILFIQIGVVTIALIIGYILAKREYKKFTVIEKEEFKKELRHPMALFHLLDHIGYVLFFIGIIFKSNILQHVAFLLIGIGWIIDGAQLWKIDHKRALIMILLGSMTFLTTTFLAIKSL